MHVLGSAFTLREGLTGKFVKIQQYFGTPMNQHAARLGRRLAYTLVAHRGGGFFDPARLAAIDALPWRRYAKFGLGGMLLAIGALTGYQQLVVRVSRGAVINARVASIRAPLGGIVGQTRC